MNKINDLITPEQLENKPASIRIDFYNLAEEEGYLTGLAEGIAITDNETKSYHNFMINMIDKYIPNWRDKIDDEYWSETEEDGKGVILSTLLCKNFKEIFYKLV